MSAAEVWTDAAGMVHVAADDLAGARAALVGIAPAEHPVRVGVLPSGRTEFVATIRRAPSGRLHELAVAGHERVHGHGWRGRLVSCDGGRVWHRVDACCGRTDADVLLEARLRTWSDVVPEVMA